MSRATVLLIAGAALLSACANSTQMVATWRDPYATPAQLGRTLAVFISTEPGMRRMVEDKLAAGLPGGVPSYQVIPDDQVANLETVRRRVASGGFDGAVIMRLVGVTTAVETSAPHDFYGYWGYFGNASDPIYYTTDRLYSVESTLYSFTDGRMIWMARSQTINPKNANKLADYSVNFAVKNLGRQGFLR